MKKKISLLLSVILLFQILTIYGYASDTDKVNIQGTVWNIDVNKTTASNNRSMRNIFGTAWIEYGDEMKFYTDNSFYYYIGAGIGGEGTYCINNEISYEIITYEEEITEYGNLSLEDGCIVQKEDGLVIYWKKTGDLTPSDRLLNGDFSEFAGTYKYNSGNSFELLANGLSNIDVSSEKTEFRVEDICESSDGTYIWSVNCYYNGECMDGVICIIYPKGVEVVSYDGRILPTDTSKVRFWSGNAEVSDVQYIAYKQDETVAEIKVVLNGEEIEFDQPPIMINDRVMVPIRAIFEEMGYVVNWDSTIQTAISTKDNNKITVQLNNNVIKYTLNGNDGEYVCDVAPQIVSERTLVPVRAIAECAGCDVDWDGNNQTVIITYDEIESLFNNIYATVNFTSMDNEGKFTMTIDFFNYTNADLENVVVKFKGDSCIGTVFDYNSDFEYSSITQGSYSEDIVKVGNLKQEFNSIAFEMYCSEKQKQRFCENSHIVNIEITGDNFNAIENKIQIQDEPDNTEILYNAFLIAGYASEEKNFSRDDVETCFLNSTQYINNALKELRFSTEIYNMNDYNRFMEYSELSEKLDQIFKYNTSNDLSVFYYSGHSIHDKYENRKPEIANDGKGNELDEIDMENFITFQQLYDLISEKIQGNVMLIYDGCFAGELLNVKNRNNRIKILAASDDDEKSTDAYITAIKGGVWQRMLQQIFNQKEMCSIFSYVFYNGIVNERDLMDTNNNMIISFDELYSYTYKEVLEIAERLNITQTPKAYPDNDATPLFTIE